MKGTLGSRTFWGILVVSVVITIALIMVVCAKYGMTLAQIVMIGIGPGTVFGLCFGFLFALSLDKLIHWRVTHAKQT